MNLYKVVIKFGKWVHKANNLYCYDRIYTNKGKPTIFCIRYFRHVGYEPHEEYEFEFEF